MFNVVERHQKLVKGVMIALTATFVVWGIGGYLGMSGDDGYVAKVGGNKIYLQDIERISQQNPSASQDKMQILFGLINRQLLLNSFADNNLTVTTKQLQTAIAAIDVFQSQGKFDVAKYESFLKQSYTTSAKFEQNIGQQILIDQTVDFFKQSYFGAEAFKNKLMLLLSRERNVAQYILLPQDFYAAINLSESAINAYYQQNMPKFMQPEQVKLQYIRLSVDDLAATLTITPAEINQYLSTHAMASEQIDVAHILFSLPANASAAQKAQIKAKAEEVLAQVKAHPSQFAVYAQRYSQDPGSAAHGGDLGLIGRGVMGKAFESAAFALTEGQISDLVETNYGFHILKLNAIKTVPLASSQQTARQQLQKQKAQQQLAAKVEQLNDTSYNQADSLTYAAEKTGLKLQDDWVVKGATQGKFAAAKLQQAIFSDEVLKRHHNSEVIDLGDGSYIVLRVQAAIAAKQKSLAEVREQIIATMKQEQGQQLAAQQGQQDLALLQQGKLNLAFTGKQNVSLLSQNQAIEPMAVKQIFAAPANFPAYVGAVQQNGAYVIYRIDSQVESSALAKQNQALVEQLADQYALMNLNAYVGGLREQYKISYKLERIKAAEVDTN